ncbi:MAG: hypothetical protein R3213_06800 [Flavobacteriaceae bacterium]|nr:hypothetical protein [Flavobacteriaceae bacterium]
MKKIKMPVVSFSYKNEDGLWLYKEPVKLTDLPPIPLMHIHKMDFHVFWAEKTALVNRIYDLENILNFLLAHISKLPENHKCSTMKTLECEALEVLKNGTPSTPLENESDKYDRKTKKDD